MAASWVAAGTDGNSRRVSLEQALGWARHVYAPPSLGQVFGVMT